MSYGVSPDLEATATTAASPTDLMSDEHVGAYGIGLPSIGEGEHSMKVFIQEHMTSILQPLAERVTEVTRNLELLTDEVSMTNDRVDRNTDHLHDHDQKVFGLNQSVTRILEDLKLAKIERDDISTKQVSQEAALDCLGAATRKLEGQQGSSESAARDFERSLEDLDTRLRQLTLSFSEQNVLHLGFTDRLNENRILIEGLNDRHLDAMKSLQEVKQSDENTRNTLKRHINSSDRQKKDDLRSMHLLDERTKAVEAMFLEQSQKLESQGKTVRATSLQLQQMGQDMEQVSGANSATTDRLRSPTEMLGVRIQRVEESVFNMGKKEASDIAGIRIQTKDLSEQVALIRKESQKNKANIDACENQAKTHGDRLKKHEDRLFQHDANVSRLQKQAGQAHGDIQQMSTLQRDLVSQMQTQAAELKKTNNDIMKTNEDLEHTNRDLSDTRQEVEGAHTKIEAQGTRMELAHEYLNGLAKGFQDTHKRVTIGADGMIQPKQMQRKMLPDIPGSRPVTPRD